MFYIMLVLANLNNNHTRVKSRLGCIEYGCSNSFLVVPNESKPITYTIHWQDTCRREFVMDIKIINLKTYEITNVVYKVVDKMWNKKKWWIATFLFKYFVDPPRWKNDMKWNTIDLCVPTFEGWKYIVLFDAWSL